jgi:hypothetical protein
VSRVRVMRSLLVVPRFVMFRGFEVVGRRVLVMLRRLFVVISALVLSHESSKTSGRNIPPALALPADKMRSWSSQTIETSRHSSRDHTGPKIRSERSRSQQPREIGHL